MHRQNLINSRIFLIIAFMIAVVSPSLLLATAGIAQETIKRAQNGDTSAQVSYGYYFDSLGNHEEAVKWYRLSAEQGLANAQFNLGACYKNGEGVTQDYEEAVKWYRLAAKQGHDGAQNNLGYCYQYGKGVTKNIGRALYWYTKSAKQGNWLAASNIGSNYLYGAVDTNHVIAKNPTTAMQWFLIADVLDPYDDITMDNMEECEGLLTDIQIREARELADDWLKANNLPKN